MDDLEDGPHVRGQAAQPHLALGGDALLLEVDQPGQHARRRERHAAYPDDSGGPILIALPPLAMARRLMPDDRPISQSIDAFSSPPDWSHYHRSNSSPRSDCSHRA